MQENLDLSFKELCLPYQGEKTSSFTRPKILFIGEAVSLAHVARPLALAKKLNLNQYDVHFACDSRYDSLFKVDMTRWHINSMPSERFLNATHKGTQLFSKEVLKSYVEEELELINKIKPDLIVGDFRLSLSVSASLSKIPYANICNAHWSPFATHKHLPLPLWNITRLFGKQLKPLFWQLEPLVYRYHAQPLNKVRKNFGLKPFNHFLEGFTYSDFTLLSDIPELVLLKDAPKNHLYLGPITWSPEVKLPKWWDQLPNSKPVVYLSLGSTGSIRPIPYLIDALKKLPVTVIVSSADKYKKKILEPNVKIANFIPGDQASKISSLVICNGGTGTVYESLKHGVPVLGIASNMDQLLAMSYVEKAGAGKLIRSNEINVKNAEQAISQLLWEEMYTSKAMLLAEKIQYFNPHIRFSLLLESLFKTRNSELKKIAN